MCVSWDWGVYLSVFVIVWVGVSLFLQWPLNIKFIITIFRHFYVNPKFTFSHTYCIAILNWENCKQIQDKV